MTTSHDPKTGSAPHDCVDCGAPCYIPFGLSPQCTNRQCQHYSEDCWVRHVVELPDDETGVEFELEDEEATDPWLKLPALKGLAGLLPDDDDGPLTPMQHKALRFLTQHPSKGFSILDGKWLVEAKQPCFTVERPSKRSRTNCPLDNVRKVC